MSQYISLNMEAVALVDDDDYEKVKPFNWFLSGTGYAVGFVPVDGKFKLTYLHRFLMNAQAGEMVDHINGYTLDNRRANLRIATPQQNGQIREYATRNGYEVVAVYRDEVSGSQDKRPGFERMMLDA